MISSNQERDSHHNSQQLPNHHPYNDVLNPPSPSLSRSLSLPLLLPTLNYVTYPPDDDMCHTMTTTIGYPSNISNNKHDLHAYPQGHIVYIDDDEFSSTIYPKKYPNNSHFLDNNYNPHAYPKGHAVYTENNGLSTKYPMGCSKMIPYYGPPPTHHQLTKKDKLLRVFILLCCLFLFAMIIAQFVLIFSGDHQDYLPTNEVTSMNVTNFITTSSSSGEWNINISLENLKDLVPSYFYNLQVSLMYKGVVFVTMKNDSSFNLELGKKKDVQVKSWSNITNNEDTRETYMREGMAKDRMSFGSITFSMEVLAFVKHKSSNLMYTDYQEMHCTHEELKVLFQNENSTTGTVDTLNNKIECRFRILK